MARTIIEVNTGTLKSDVSNIEGAIRALRTEARNLSVTANQLFGMWEGPAKEAFRSAVQGDLNRLDNLIKAMEKFTNLTDQSRQEYERCESKVSQIVAAIRV